MKPIYLDYNASTPVAARVLEVMLPYFTERFGNASSQAHAYGWEAEAAVKQSREKIAALLGSKDPRSIIFTSGATESNNLALKGIVGATPSPQQIITQPTEHKCVLESCRKLEAQGHSLAIIAVDEFGQVDLSQLQASFTPQSRLVSIMAANNEIGTLQPITKISELCHDRGILFHTDGAQAVGKIPLHVENDRIDLLSFSGHKLYGPKGIGALYINPKIPIPSIKPLLDGGGHERGVRSGTLNVPGIVGLAKALEIAMDEMERETKRLRRLQQKIISALISPDRQIYLNGHPEARLANNINLSPLYLRAEDLITKLPELALSTGSACASNSQEPSYVLRAITPDQLRQQAAIRIGLGRFTTEDEVDRAIALINGAITGLRRDSLEYELATKIR